MVCNWAVGDALGKLNGKGQGACFIWVTWLFACLGFSVNKGPFEVNR